MDRSGPSKREGEGPRDRRVMNDPPTSPLHVRLGRSDRVRELRARERDLRTVENHLGYECSFRAG